ILKGMTAQYLLHRTHKVQPGDYVLIHAAAGGMGHILCPWARHLGATVIGTVSTDAKAEIARNLGCHHVINYSTADFVAVPRKITDAKGVDVVYESIGKDTLQRSLDCLRLVGMCAAYGQASGVPDPIDLIKDLGARGSLIITRPALSHYLSNRSEIDAAAKSLFEAVAQGGRSEQRCQNLSASGGCSRAQVHRRTQDNGLDRHASIRVSGCKEAGKTTSAALVDDVTAAAQEASQSTQREHDVDHTPRNQTDNRRKSRSADHQPGGRSRQRRLFRRHYSQPDCRRCQNPDRSSAATRR